jgi:small subunit ribosomal protein S2
MKPYIFGRRNLIHIIDIRETVKGLLRAKKFIIQVVSRGQDVLFVGTKRQARHALVEHATRVGMPYVAKRWLGGTLTNFQTIRSRLARLDELEAAEADGSLQQYSKKAIASRNRELRKIKSNLEGIRAMDKLPAALLVIDVRREHLAVREAKKLGIPAVCLIDTDSDPDYADIPIPGNDDSMRSIEAILAHLASAVEVGKRARVMAAPAAKDESEAPRRSARRPMGEADGEGGEKPEAETAGAEAPVAVPSGGQPTGGEESAGELAAASGDAGPASEMPLTGDESETEVPAIRETPS